MTYNPIASHEALVKRQRARGKRKLSSLRLRNKTYESSTLTKNVVRERLRKRRKEICVSEFRASAGFADQSLTPPVSEVQVGSAPFVRVIASWVMNVPSIGLSLRWTARIIPKSQSRRCMSTIRPVDLPFEKYLPSNGNATDQPLVILHGLLYVHMFLTFGL